MKKIFISLLCLSFMFTVCSCGSKDNSSDSSNDSKIISDAKKTQENKKDDKNKKITAPPTKTNDAAGEKSKYSQPVAPSNGNIDIDISGVNKNVVYAQVMQMMMSPDNFIGKRIRMTGQFIVYDALPGNQSGATEYYALLIVDALACCQQGIEFVWPNHSFPNDFPEVKSEATVTGIFEVYEEDGKRYCRLVAEDVKAQ
ncbi:MAG: hypothetical protein SPI74_00485 [Eubacterium sp.]|nr:hypothetical protein [Eubacterium sp.]